MTLAMVVTQHCGDVPYSISDALLQVSHIVYVTTRVVAILVVPIFGLINTHYITGVMNQIPK